jgi:hypothetical protein
MRRTPAVLLALSGVIPSLAAGQTAAPTVITPGALPPHAPIVATPLPPPGAETTRPTAAPPTTPKPLASQYPDVWRPAQEALIQALDKVNARHSDLTLRPGVPTTYQSLTITLRACLIRPPDQPADAAAFVTVTDSRGGEPRSLWLIRSAPAVSMLEHPIFDLRVLGCPS